MPNDPDYPRAWYEMMIRIWKDRLSSLGAIDTSALYNSVTGTRFHADDLDFESAFQFLQYGLYVDLGTGNGYTRGNGGDLQFKRKSYRIRHNLGKTRNPRPWFSRSWYISQQVLKDYYARRTGEKYLALLSSFH